MQEEVAAEPEGDGLPSVLTMQQAGPTPEEMNAIVDSFNETQPGIVVQIDYVSYDALHDKIVTSMASSAPAYDVIPLIWYAELPIRATSGMSPTSSATKRSPIFDSPGSSTVWPHHGMPWLLDAKPLLLSEALLEAVTPRAPGKSWSPNRKPSRNRALSSILSSGPGPGRAFIKTW